MLSEREALIEAFGLYFERYGLARIIGRIYGLLLITDQPNLGLDDLTQELGISKASASTGVRHLVQFGLVTKASRPADRRDYYEAAADGYSGALVTGIQKLLEMTDLLHRAAALSRPGSVGSQRLRETLGFYEALDAMFMRFVEDYRRDPAGTIAAARGSAEADEDLANEKELA